MSRAHAAPYGNPADVGSTDAPYFERTRTPSFTLEPLGPEHNERDYDASTSSEKHIHATPAGTTARGRKR